LLNNDHNHHDPFARWFQGGYILGNFTKLCKEKVSPFNHIAIFGVSIRQISGHEDHLNQDLFDKTKILHPTKKDDSNHDLGKTCPKKNTPQSFNTSPLKKKRKQ